MLLKTLIGAGCFAAIQLKQVSERAEIQVTETGIGVEI